MQIPPQHFHCGSQISACQVFSNKSLILHNITFSSMFSTTPLQFFLSPKIRKSLIRSTSKFEQREKKQSILFLQIIVQHYAHYQHSQLGKIQFLKFTLSNSKWIIIEENFKMVFVVVVWDVKI